MHGTTRCPIRRYACMPNDDTRPSAHPPCRRPGYGTWLPDGINWRHACSCGWGHVCMRGAAGCDRNGLNHCFDRRQTCGTYGRSNCTRRINRPWFAYRINRLIFPCKIIISGFTYFYLLFARYRKITSRYKILTFLFIIFGCPYVLVPDFCS